MLQQSTLNYIKKLSQNNNKQWFDENRNLFENAKGRFRKTSKRYHNSFRTN
jgi:uncharacterized protein (DUF2461 family)